jgi:excisionase family DNA binding protein
MIKLDKLRSILGMNQTKLISIKQASELLGVAPLTLRRWDKSGRLKSIRVGSREDRRYDENKLLELIQKGKI